MEDMLENSHVIEVLSREPLPNQCMDDYSAYSNKRADCPTRPVGLLAMSTLSRYNFFHLDFSLFRDCGAKQSN